jgi:hypothetical protein
MHTQRLFPPLSERDASAMETLLKAIDEARPLAQKWRKALPYAIRDLWASLTHSKDERKSAYLSEKENLSAYLRYFLPWNVYRYLRLFPALDFSFLKSDSVVADLGSGPLSVVIALYIARPELRALPLTVYAVDRAPLSLEAGADILSALALALEGSLPAWRIIRVHGNADVRLKEKADLACAGYFLNEFDRKESPSLDQKAARAARLLEDRLKPSGRILALESGDTKASSLIAALRAHLLGSGFQPLAPCPHCEPCPMPGFYRATRSQGSQDGQDPEAPQLIRDHEGRPLVLASGKRPWCHFTFQSPDAPLELLRLSEKAGLPKEGASLSFLLMAKPAEPSQPRAQAAQADSPSMARIVSEEFPLPEGHTGRYACCRSGYALLRAPGSLGPWRALIPGDLLPLPTAPSETRDKKTRALVFDVGGPQGARSPRNLPERPPAAPQRELAKPQTKGKSRQGKKTPRKGTLPPGRPGGSPRS